MAKSKQESYTPEVRWVEHHVHETGQEPSVRVDRELELGVELDGAWLRFGSIGEGRVEALQRAHQVAEERAANGNGGQASGEDTTA